MHNNFDLQNFSEIERYLNKTYINSFGIEPIAFIYINNAFKNQVLKIRIQKQVSNKLFIQYFNNVEVLVKSTITKETPAIVICLESQLTWIKKFAKNESDKIITYTQFVKQTPTQQIFSFIHKAYTEYKNTINKTKLNQNRADTNQWKKRTLYFYYTKDNQQFYHFLKLKINTNNEKFNKVEAYCYKQIEDLLVQIKKVKSSEFRIIISNSKNQHILKQKIPPKTNYKILVYNKKKILNDNQVQVDNNDPYQKMMASSVITLMISTQMEEQSLIAIKNILSNAPKIIIAEFDSMNIKDMNIKDSEKSKRKDVNSNNLEQLLMKQTQKQFSLIIIQQYQRQEIIDLINRHNFSNILIIEHFMECLYINCEEPMIVFQYCELQQFTVFLAQLKQNVLVSANSIFGNHIKILNLFIFKNHPIYFTLLQNCNNNILPNVRLVKFEDQFHLKSLISGNQCMNLVNMILCAQDELLSLIKNNIITPKNTDSNLKLIVYPTKQTINQFKDNIVALATNDEQEIVNFIKGFQKTADIVPQEYQKSIIQSHIKIKLKSIKRVENNKQKFILPQQGRPKIFIHIPKNLKSSQSKIFKNRVYKIFKTDLVFEEYEKIQDVVFFNFGQQPLSYTVIQQQNLQWGIDFAETCLEQHSFRLIIFSSTQNIKTNNLSRIKLVTTKFKQIQKYIIQDVKKYQKKYLSILKKIYTQFIEGCKEDNPVHVMYTIDKKINLIIKNNKIVDIQGFSNYDEIIKLTSNPSRKNIIIIDAGEQEKILQKFKKLKVTNYFFLVVGGNFITKQDDKVIFRTKGYKQMQHFIKKVILREEVVEVKSYIDVYQKWNFMKKKILVYYPTNYLKFNKVLSSSYIEEIEFQQYTKIQDLKTQFIQLYPTFYIILKDNTDVDKNSKFLENTIFPSIQNTTKMYQIHEIQNVNKARSKSAYFSYTNIQELKKMIQNITQKKKKQIITKITKRYNQPIVLHKQTFYSEHNKVIYLRYANNDELFRIISEMKLNRFFLTYLMITVTEDEYKKIKTAAEGMDKIIFIVICESMFKNFNEISGNDNIICFFDNDNAQDFVMKLPQNMESRKKKLSVIIQDLEFLKKLEKRLKARYSKCSTEIQLNLFANNLPQKPQNQYMFIVSKETFLNLNSSKKGKFNELFYFVIKSKEIVNDPVILFNSNNETELLNFLSNLEKTQKVPFVEYQQELAIYSHINFKDKNLHKTIHSVQYYSQFNQLAKLLQIKKLTPPILILNQSTDSLLIQTSSQVYRMIYCSSDIRESRPLFQLPETFLVANEFDSINKYISLLAPQQKKIMYCSNSLFKYRRNKIIQSRIQYLQYKAISDLYQFLKPKTQKRTIYQVLCQKNALNQIQKYLGEFQKIYPKNKYRAVVVVTDINLQNQNGFPRYIFKDNLIKLYDFVSDKAQSIQNQSQIKSPDSPNKENNQLESSEIIFNRIDFENNFKIQKGEGDINKDDNSISKDNYYQFGKPSLKNQQKNFNITNGNSNKDSNSPNQIEKYYEFGELKNPNAQNVFRLQKIDNNNNKDNLSPVQDTFYKFGKLKINNSQKLMKIQKVDVKKDSNSSKLLKGVYVFGTLTTDPANLKPNTNRQQNKINQFTIKIQETLNNQRNNLIYSIGQENKMRNDELQYSKSEDKVVQQKNPDVRRRRQKNRNSNIDPEFQLYGFEGFVKRSDRKDMNYGNQAKVKKSPRCLTLILDTSRKETRGISLSYKNAYQDAKIMKFLNKDQFLTKLKQLGKDDGIIVINRQNQDWLVGCQQRPNHKFIIVGYIKQPTQNKIYIKDFRNLMQELTSINQSKNIRKRSISNSANNKKQKSLSKNKLIIKKVREVRNALVQYGDPSDPSSIYIMDVPQSLKNSYQLNMSIPNGNNTIIQNSSMAQDSIRYNNKFNQTIQQFHNK